jgi:glycosyltransferase involved in cell wall biosynthesis
LDNGDRTLLPLGVDMAAEYTTRATPSALCCGAVPVRRILVNALSLTQAGGGRSYLLNVLRELDRDPRGFEFTVLANPTQLSPAEARGIDIVRVRLPAKGGARLPLRVAYEEVALPVRAGRFDLLYCPADVAPAFATIPTVVVLQNMHIYDHTYYDTFRTHLLNRLVRAGVRRARRVLFLTRAAANRISQQIPIPPQRIAIVPHGVSPESFEAVPDEPAGAGGETPYLFLPASLERHKRIEVLIRSLLHVEDPALEVWIAGSELPDPEHAAELHRLVESLGLEQRVRFLGPVPYRDILRYYRGAVALAFTSLLETFGHPTLEAMLAGTPIIAADIPAFREIAGDIALYFEPDDPAALARAVDRLRRDPEAARSRVARGRARAAEFSWKRSVDSLCTVFEEVLSESHRRSA